MEREFTLREDIERELLERLQEYDAAILEAIQEAIYNGASKAAIMRAYGTKDYRTVQNYIDRVQERFNITEAIAPARFTFAGVNGKGEILVHDTVENDEGRLYIGEWKGDWEHNLYGVRYGKLWDSIPELERLVSDVEGGRFVPTGDVERLAPSIRERIHGAPKATTLTVEKSEPSFDDWEM